MFRSGHKPPAFSSFSASAAMTRTGHPARLLCDVEAWSQTADVRSFQSSTFDVEQQSPSAALTTAVEPYRPSGPDLATCTPRTFQPECPSSPHTPGADRKRPGEEK